MSDSAAPRTIGKYEIIGTLGRGSMGMVYKAKDPEIGRTVAIKVLRRIAATSALSAEAALERFKIEARSSGNLRHPHIITVFDVNSLDDSPYLVMDFIEGEGLDQLLERSTKLESEQALNFLGQIASGLDYAHARGVIHRDIKPSNIIVDKNNSSYILDFGVASIGTSEPKQGEPIMGTPGYMSPEQILNNKLDARADLFSLAVVAFELLAGQRPFKGADFTTVVSNILANKRSSICDIVPNLPLALDAVFERALSREAADRYSTARELVAALAEPLGFEGPNQAGVVTKRSAPAPTRPVVRDDPDPHWDRSVGAGTVVGGFDDRPGGIFSHSQELVGAGSRFTTGLSGTQILTTIFGVISILLGGLLLWYFLSATGMDQQPAFVVVQPNDSSGGETIKVGNPAVVGEPSSKIPEEMTADELVATVSNPRASDAQIVGALHEISARRVVGLVPQANQLLIHDAYVVRLETLRALAAIGDPRAVGAASEALDDHDQVVRIAAAQTLERLSDKRAIGSLNARLMVEDSIEVKRALISAVEKLNGYPYDPKLKAQFLGS